MLWKTGCLIREQEGMSKTGPGLAPCLLKGRLEMKVPGEEWCRVRVAVEREGDAQVFSHASCWHSYYLLKLLRKQRGCLWQWFLSQSISKQGQNPCSALTEYIGLGHNIWESGVSFTVTCIDWKPWHKNDSFAIKCELLLTPVLNISVLYKRLGNSITELTQR